MHHACVLDEHAVLIGDVVVVERQVAALLAAAHEGERGELDHLPLGEFAVDDDQLHAASDLDLGPSRALAAPTGGGGGRALALLGGSPLVPLALAEVNDRLANLDLVSRREHRLLGEGRTVELGSVAALEVLDQEAVVGPADLAVVPGGQGVRDLDGVVGGTADADFVLVEGQLSQLAVLFDDERERPLNCHSYSAIRLDLYDHAGQVPQASIRLCSLPGTAQGSGGYAPNRPFASRMGCQV